MLVRGQVRDGVVVLDIGVRLTERHEADVQAHVTSPLTPGKERSISQHPPQNCHRELGLVIHPQNIIMKLLFNNFN